jgi:tetratricopeptide (TPR) repeat protein
MNFGLLVGGAILAALLVQARGVLAIILSRGKYDVADYDGALRIVRWVSLGIPNPLVLHREGLTLSVSGRLSEAEQRYRKAMAMAAGTKYPMERLHVCLGNVLTDRGRYQEAEQCFLRAIDAGDVTGSAECSLAEVRLLQGVEPEKALEWADRAIERAKRRPGGRISPAFWVTRAWALGVLGRGDEAREALSEAMQAPEASVPGRAEMHWRAGRALVAMQQPGEARKHFEMGRGADPRGKYGRRCGDELRGLA